MGRKEEDLALLSHPDEWVQWPICPVVKRGGRLPTAGLVLAGNLTVYEFNMWALETGPLAPQLEGAPKHIYTNYEAMLADGWEVD